MIAAVLVSCKKNSTDTPSPVQKQDVEFQINTILPDAGRDYNIPLCDDNLSPDYAMIILDDYTGDGIVDTLSADVYYIGDQLYTKALQMLPGDYTVIGFLVYDDLTGDGPSDDDMIYKAAPMPNTEFSEFVVNSLNIAFTVEQFKKTKILIDVLCFVPDYYDLFGFFWFQITEITVREICFFGDLCLKTPSDYEGSPYAEDGLFIDEPAIFQIFAQHKVGDGPWEDMNGGQPYTNLSWYGTGAPLCIRYADYDHEVDQYKFELKVLVKVGNDFEYVTMYTWEWSDIFEDTYDPGNDGVEEFVIGNCNYSPTDIQLNPYMNLPTTITMELEAMGFSNNYYWNWMMTYAEPDDGDYYDIPYNTWTGAWCGDLFHQIGNGTHTGTLVFSTLDDPADMPAGNGLSTNRLNKLNYLFNHYGDAGIDIFNLQNSSEGVTVQQAIWAVRHSNDGANAYTDGSFGTTALSLANDALMNGGNYSPLPGGNAGVLFFAQSPGKNVFIAQLILITVDP
jgi:hypothetical protein